jgi:hypothetical protein
LPGNERYASARSLGPVISDDGGFGEVLIMIAIMVAFQAELIWRRARTLGPASYDRELVK